MYLWYGRLAETNIPPRSVTLSRSGFVTSNGLRYSDQTARVTVSQARNYEKLPSEMTQGKLDIPRHRKEEPYGVNLEY